MYQWENLQNPLQLRIIHERYNINNFAHSIYENNFNFQFLC